MWVEKQMKPIAIYSNFKKDITFVTHSSTFKTNLSINV